MSAQGSQSSDRKAIPKSVRFEVLKRDSFKCQYCGASAPDVLLQIDHIKPVDAGGTNDITNLIASCAACNSGKSNRTLDDRTAVKKRKAQLDELQDRREQLEMMMEWMESLQDLKSQALSKLSSYWTNLAPGFHPNERGVQKIRRWLSRYSLEEISNAMDIAAAQYLGFKDDGTVTQKSWEIAFHKIPGILGVERDSRDDPDLKELLYIRGIVRNKCEYYYDNGKALEWLRVARRWGIPLSQLKQIAFQTRKWSQFTQLIGDAIEEWKARHQDEARENQQDA